METVDFGISNDYAIRWSASPVFEIALGIASFTREEIHDKLDQGLDDLRELRNGMSDALRTGVQLAGQVHTWRNLLFLAHRCPNLETIPVEQHVDYFLRWMEAEEKHLLELAAPFLGDDCSEQLKGALSGDEVAQKGLLEMHFKNPVVYFNLKFLFSIEVSALLHHLQELTERWSREILSQNVNSLMNAMQDDISANANVATRVASHELVRHVTKGGEIQAVPGVTTLWLIPQIAYRPFTIVNYLPHILVYYYPVSERFLPGGDRQDKRMRVAALHKAVGDVQRLQLLELLHVSPKSLAQLTDALRATKSNVHHHLSMLRFVGLVEVKHGVYSINVDAVHDLGEELRELLHIG